MIGNLIVAPSPELLPAPLFAPTPKAAKRTVEFFTAQINNDHTRRSYLNAARRFAAWCKTNGIEELVDVEPFHVAGFIKELQGTFSPPTLKQHLAALRMLFDWLVTGHIMEMNPAHSVRGPKPVVKRGKTPVLTNDEARSLLDSIDVSTLKGLRDRALIGVMVYTFARVNAVIRMKVNDYFTQGRRGWVRLHEKGGKEHDVPCHHTLDVYLDEYIAAANIAEGACHVTGGFADRRVGSGHERVCLPGLPVPADHHPARGVGVSALHHEPQGRRGPARKARCHRVL